MIAGAYDWTDDMLKIKSMQKKFRDSFNGTEINPARWEIAATGGGITHTVADGAVTISTGTTLDDELTLTSRTTFTIPLRVMVAVNMSQRIVGQSVWLELVSIDPTTGQPDGRNAAARRLDGASATLANYEVASEGAPRLASPSASTIPTTAATGWSVLELEPTNDECYFHGRLIDNTAARSNSYVRHQQIPEPNALYTLRIRVRNRQYINGISAVANNGGGAVRITRAAHGFATNDVVTVADVTGVPGANSSFTITVIDVNSFDLVGSAFTGAYVNTGWASVSRNLAAASSTDIKVQFVTIADYAELTTEITAGRGQAGTMSESQELVFLQTFARRIRVTRQMLVNDDLGAFTDFASMIGRRVADFENATAYALVNSAGGDGPTLTTGAAAVFGTAVARANKASAGTLLDLPNLAAGRAAVMKQKTLDGLPIAVGAQMRLLVGPNQELAARQLTVSVQATQTSNANVYAGFVQPLVEPLIPANRWYLFSDPMAAPVYVYGYLNGAEGPQVTTGNVQGVDGVEVSVIFDFGVGAIDWRGAWFNPGT